MSANEADSRPLWTTRQAMVREANERWKNKGIGGKTKE